MTPINSPNVSKPKNIYQCINIKKPGTPKKQEYLGFHDTLQQPPDVAVISRIVGLIFVI